VDRVARGVSMSLMIAVAMMLAACPCFAAKAGLGCTVRTAAGTGPSVSVAKYQVYEGLLRTAGTSVWATWLTSGATPGYKVKTVKYVCYNDTGLGVSCRGKATICKL
jgi:hypothetical protein